MLVNTFIGSKIVIFLDATKKQQVGGSNLVGAESKIRHYYQYLSTITLKMSSLIKWCCNTEQIDQNVLSSIALLDSFK